MFCKMPKKLRNNTKKNEIALGQSIQDANRSLVKGRRLDTSIPLSPLRLIHLRQLLTVIRVTKIISFNFLL